MGSAEVCQTWRSALALGRCSGETPGGSLAQWLCQRHVLSSEDWPAEMEGQEYRALCVCPESEVAAVPGPSCGPSATAVVCSSHCVSPCPSSLQFLDQGPAAFFCIVFMARETLGIKMAPQAIAKFKRKIHHLRGTQVRPTSCRWPPRVQRLAKAGNLPPSLCPPGPSLLELEV